MGKLFWLMEGCFVSAIAIGIAANSLLVWGTLTSVGTFIMGYTLAKKKSVETKTTEEKQ